MIGTTLRNEKNIPDDLAHLGDFISVLLWEDSLSRSSGEAEAFPLRLLEAIPVGADLSLVTAKFMIWQFEDEKYGLKNLKEVQEDKEVRGFCEEAVTLYRRLLAGDRPSEEEFRDLYVKIDRDDFGARADIRDWAKAWIRVRRKPWYEDWAVFIGGNERAKSSAWVTTGANTWAKLRAKVRAKAWAEVELLVESKSAAVAAEVDALARTGGYDEHPYWIAAADKLIELIEESK